MVDEFELKCQALFLDKTPFLPRRNSRNWIRCPVQSGNSTRRSTPLHGSLPTFALVDEAYAKARNYAYAGGAGKFLGMGYIPELFSLGIHRRTEAFAESLRADNDLYPEQYLFFAEAKPR